MEHLQYPKQNMKTRIILSKTGLVCIMVEYHMPVSCAETS